MDVVLNRDLEANPPAEWSDDIDQTLFPATTSKEPIFFPNASRTLIVTNAVINLELEKISETW